MKKSLILALLTLTGSANAMLRSQSQENLLAIYYKEHNQPRETVLQMSSEPVRDRTISTGAQQRADDNQESSICEDCLLMAEENCDQRRATYGLLCCSIPAFVCLFGGALGAVLLLGS